MKTLKARIEDGGEACPLDEYFSFDVRPYTALVQFDRAETILQENERPAYLYYLIEGRAKYFLHARGHVSTIGFLGPSRFIGEMELFGTRRAINGVVAAERCVCYAIDTGRCGERMLDDAKFLRFLCRSLVRIAVESGDAYTRLGQAPPLNVRLASYILRSSADGYYREKHTEVAEYMGVAYRHLLYVIAGFVKSGLLQKTEKGYFIADETALRRIADGAPPAGGQAETR